MKLPQQDFWGKFKERTGAFSTAEAIALFNIVNDVPDGNAIEAGTHKGKSSSVIALAMKPNNDLFLVEPEFADTDWAEDTFNFVRQFNDKINITLFQNESLDVIPICKNLSFAFIDSGSHCDNLPIDESKLLEDMIMPDGVIAFHDIGNQFSKPQEAAEYLISTGKYDWVNIDWEEIFNYVRENNLEDGNNSWHEKGSEEFPKFVGALKRKK